MQTFNPRSGIINLNRQMSWKETETETETETEGPELCLGLDKYLGTLNYET